jgi:hypothetical protein
MNQSIEIKQNRMLAIAFVPLAIALNVGIGAIEKR